MIHVYFLDITTSSRWLAGLRLGLGCVMSKRLLGVDVDFMVCMAYRSTSVLAWGTV